MFYYSRSWRRYSKLFCRLFSIFIFSFFIGFSWSLVNKLLYNDEANFIKKPNTEISKSALIFCFVLSSNNRHLTSSPAILYSWGKRCDRFYFVTRLQNTSIQLMMLEKFENITDITSTTIIQNTIDVLLYLQGESKFSSYHWFLRASDESFVIIPNLRQLITQLQIKEYKHPLAYVGDVEQMYEKYHIETSGSVMLFNRNALDRLVAADSEDSEQELELDNRRCSTKMIYDHELVKCMKRIGININPINDNLILSQNLSIYKMDKRLKGICCSPNTVAFRAINETDMYKFEFFYHRLDALT